MDNQKLKSIRESEKKSHLEIYSTAKLFEKGSWLQKPVKSVMDLMPLLKERKELRILDLGCGVGRNCIPIAQEYKYIQCKIDCVDILDFAITELNKNAIKFGVFEFINGIVSSIENYQIENKEYDLIFAVSALEHVSSDKLFTNKLFEIREGINEGGFVCLIINSEVIETDKESDTKLVPQFEVNMKTDVLNEILKDIFLGWNILKFTVAKQHYDIPRENCVAALETNVVTFVARNTTGQP